MAAPALISTTPRPATTRYGHLLRTADHQLHGVLRPMRLEVVELLKSRPLAILLHHLIFLTPSAADPWVAISVGDLVRQTTLSRACVSKSLKWLRDEERGFLERRKNQDTDSSAAYQYRVCAEEIVEALRALGYELVDVDRLMGRAEEGDARDFAQLFTDDPSLSQGFRLLRLGLGELLSSRAGALVLQQLIYRSVKRDPDGAQPIEASARYLEKATTISSSRVDEILRELQARGFIEEVDPCPLKEASTKRRLGRHWRVHAEVIAQELRELGYDEATAAKVLGSHHEEDHAPPPPAPDTPELEARLELVARVEPFVAQVWPEVSSEARCEDIFWSMGRLESMGMHRQVASHYILERAHEMGEREQRPAWKRACRYLIEPGDLKLWGYRLPDEILEQLPRARRAPASRGGIHVADVPVHVPDDGGVHTPDKGEHSIKRKISELRHAARARDSTLTQKLLKDLRGVWPEVTASQAEWVGEQLLLLGWTEEVVRRYVLERLEEMRLRKSLPIWSEGRRYLTSAADIRRYGYDFEKGLVVIDKRMHAVARGPRSSRSEAFLRKLHAPSHAPGSSPPASSEVEELAKSEAIEAAPEAPISPLDPVWVQALEVFKAGTSSSNYREFFEPLRLRRTPRGVLIGAQDAFLTVYVRENWKDWIEHTLRGLGEEKIHWEDGMSAAPPQESQELADPTDSADASAPSTSAASSEASSLEDPAWMLASAMLKERVSSSNYHEFIQPLRSHRTPEGLVLEAHDEFWMLVTQERCGEVIEHVLEELGESTPSWGFRE